MAGTGPILALVDDLLMASRVESACRARGLRALFPLTADECREMARRERPALILVALAARRLPWEELVAELKAGPDLGSVPVLAFGPHMDLGLRQRALDAGCDRVVANSQITTEFDRILQQMGVPTGPAPS